MMSQTDGAKALAPGVAVAILLSALGGGVAWLISDNAGHGLTVAAIGLLIGIGICLILALGGSRTSR